MTEKDGRCEFHRVMSGQYSREVGQAYRIDAEVRKILIRSHSLGPHLQQFGQDLLQVRAQCGFKVDLHGHWFTGAKQGSLDQILVTSQDNMVRCICSEELLEYVQSF